MIIINKKNLHDLKRVDRNVGDMGYFLDELNFNEDSQEFCLPYYTWPRKGDVKKGTTPSGYLKVTGVKDFAIKDEAQIGMSLIACVCVDLNKSRVIIAGIIPVTITLDVTETFEIINEFAQSENVKTKGS